jgi:hypothetical protein
MMVNIFTIADDVVELINNNLLDEAFEHMKENCTFNNKNFVPIVRIIKKKDPICSRIFSDYIRVMATTPIIVTEEDRLEKLEKTRQRAEDTWAEELVMMVSDKRQLDELHKLYPVIKSISSKVDSFPSLIENIRNRNNEVADIIETIANEVQVNNDNKT